MTPYWLIEEFVHDDSIKSLIQAVKSQRHRLRIFNVANHFEFDAGEFDANDCLVFQGSLQMGAKVKSELPGCHPVIWNNPSNFACQKYYSHLASYLFNDRCVWTTLEQLNQKKFFYYGLFGKDSMIFVRPDSGDKPFTGQLVDLQDFDRWYAKVKERNGQDLLVLISTPKNIRGEWRFLVTNQKEIISYSTYQYQKQRTLIPSAPEGATDLVKRILKNDWHPEPVYTIDICEGEDGQYYLLEINSFSSSGLYAMDKEKVVRRVSEIAVEEWKKKNEN